MGLIYLDNAATSWPKPRCTVQAMARALEESGANPGRAGHRLSLEAGRIVERCRQALADMLGETDASRVAFAQNATDALNMAIHGAVRTGDHVVSTLIEHNSVLRPLSELARSGVITLTLVPPDADGRMDAREIERALTARTRLVAMTHTSNVLGLEQDVAAVGAVCRRRGVLSSGGRGADGGSSAAGAEKMGLHHAGDAGAQGAARPARHGRALGRGRGDARAASAGRDGFGLRKHVSAQNNARQSGERDAQSAGHCGIICGDAVCAGASAGGARNHGRSVRHDARRAAGDGRRSGVHAGGCVTAQLQCGGNRLAGRRLGAG